jgi:hypothetical protein
MSHLLTLLACQASNPDRVVRGTQLSLSKSYGNIFKLLKYLPKDPVFNTWGRVGQFSNANNFTIESINTTKI